MRNKVAEFFKIICMHINIFKYAIYIVLNIATAIAALGSVFFLGQIVNTVFVDYKLPLDIIGKYVFVSLFVQLANVVMSHINNDIDLDVGYGIEKCCLEKIYGTSYLRFQNQDPSDITQKINIDSNTISGTLLFDSIELLKDIVVILFCIVAIERISLVYMIAVVIFAVVNVSSYLLLKRKLYQIDTSVQLKNMNLFTDFFKALCKMKSIRNGGLAQECFKRVDDSYSIFRNERKKYVHIENVYGTIKNTIQLVFQIGILGLGVYGLQHKMIDISSWIVITTYFSYINQSVINVLDAGKKYLKLKISINRLWEYISLPQIKKGTIDNLPCNSLSFKNTQFSYPKSDKKICVDFNFEKGKIYWISGKNGAGKSTLINLLSGLYGNDYKGAIEYDEYLQEEVDIDKLLREKVLIVEQFPYIFEGNVKDYFACDDEAKIREKLLGYRLDPESIFEKFKNGHIDEELSGGEKQKLEIIKAMLSNKELFVFDEITASLDKASKEQFYKELNNKRENRIIIMISHEKPQYYDDIVSM